MLLFVCLFCLKPKALYFLLIYMACSDIYKTKYSRGHESFVKIKNAGGGWQLFFFYAGRERVNIDSLGLGYVY